MFAKIVYTNVAEEYNKIYLPQKPRIVSQSLDKIKNLCYNIVED